ncbi:hypothetical protein MKW98_025124, partial [Papaver atlanticum]
STSHSLSLDFLSLNRIDKARGSYPGGSLCQSNEGLSMLWLKLKAINGKIAQAAAVDYQSNIQPSKLKVDPDGFEDVDKTEKSMIQSCKSWPQYQHLLSEFRAQNEQTPQADDSSGLEVAPSADSAGDANELAETKPDPSTQFKPVRKVLVPPEPETYTVRLPVGITGRN